VTKGRWHPLCSALCAIALIGAALPIAAQDAPRLSPAALVRGTVKNEIAAAQDTTAKHIFRSHKQTPRGTQTHLYVETNDAMAGMLIASNGQPLTEQQEQGEVGHLTWLMDNPDQLRKKQAREKEDADRSLRIVRALPDAFLYQYDGTEHSGPGLGKEGDELARLKFTPNPAYSPPSRVEAALEGMEGYLLIDEGAKRIAKIDGTLFRDITFGWGLVGRLDKGGHFVVRQADVGDGSWEITEMKLDIKGKILLIKSISMVSDEVLSDFRREPDNLSFAQAVQILKSEQQKLARGEDAISKQAPR
jgi:hypothetical protein